MSLLRAYGYACTLVVLVFGLRIADAAAHYNHNYNRYYYPQIIVDQSGHANFSTIQSAIDSVPFDNTQWVCIRVKNGVYREKLTIPRNKPFIILKGTNKRETQVAWDDHASIAQSPTLTVLADNFVAKSISFTNSYNHPWEGNKNPRVPAVAALISGDNCSFHRVGFFGVQDTLWDDRGRHYFKSCTIEGIVDFIFGSGQSIYEGCTISVLGNALAPDSPGFITAQARENPNDQSGFVFKECYVIGTGLTYLGRPWRDFARVLFYNTSMSSVVDPKGWYSWNMAGHEHQLSMGEYGCYGAGADRSQRVSWEKKYSWPEVKNLVNIDFIDSEKWLFSQPF